jgi:hypothetical protein
MRRQFGGQGAMRGVLLGLGIALLFPCITWAGSPATSFTTLSADRCLAPAKAGYDVPLGTTWDTYKTYVRACPLATSSKTPVKVWLLTIFADPYVADHPNQEWPDFPHPLLVTADGHCLGSLPELFPSDPPRELILRYGAPVNGVPGEIRVHVSNPAVSGDYDLPVLKWVQQRGQYAAQNDTDLYKKEELTCPI